MVGQIFLADVALFGEVGRDVLRHSPHQTALVIAREDGGGWALRLIVLRFALGYPDEEERQRLQQLLLRQYLPIKEFDRILVGVSGRIGQPHVVPAEVLLFARVGGWHYVASIGGKVEERVLENLVLLIAG